MNDIPPAWLYLVAATIAAAGLISAVNPSAVVRLFQAARPKENDRGIIARWNRRYWAQQNTESIVGTARIVGVAAVFFGILVGVAIYAARLAGG